MNTFRLNLAQPIPFAAFEHPINAAILLSLFCDRRVEGERGWWGDDLASAPYDQWGSRLWVLQQGKNTAETLRLTEDYSREALEWMKKDGLARSIQVRASAAQNETLFLSIIIDGKPLNLELNHAY